MMVRLPAISGRISGMAARLPVAKFISLAMRAAFSGRRKKLMKVCALLGWRASRVMAMVSMKIRPPVLGSRASSTSVLPISRARLAAMLMSPDQPSTTQAWPPAKVSIMVEVKMRMCGRTVISISSAAW